MASWLADALLYDLDEELSQMNGFYTILGRHVIHRGRVREAMGVLQSRLEEKTMKLNPKKVGIPDYGQSGSNFLDSASRET